MSQYFRKGKGWKYDFTLNKKRYTKSWFPTKAEAKKEEGKRKEEILNPTPKQIQKTHITFLELLNKRLSYVKDYNSKRHYTDYIYFGRRWVKFFGDKTLCNEIVLTKCRDYLHTRKKVSSYTANKELRYLRSTFNWGIKENLIFDNPTQGISFFPVEKNIKYVPPKEDILSVIIAANNNEQDYLWVILETMARINEINNLTWEDVNFESKYIVLYTRKKRGGHKTPRKIPMTEKLNQVLSYRYKNRDKTKAWVFVSEKTGKSYQYRKNLIKKLCFKAKVKQFSFHALRHYGASVLDNAGVNTGTIQRLLGHERRETTEIYLHSFDKNSIEAMQILEKSHSISHSDENDKKKKNV